ncbi:hypothetical protein DDZ13_10920 [Coraliomargarita sinensis]|uniref:LTD domain-containing protein n=1 Tax=Coraliomargarita sinensis TaxID=2174842 RepID=A0A317ZEU1_9BACT|nr:thrombospondin type 3 repeat-containing protein [Coraliomargarita sinensis]PXA03790.1 hypothetical protein DDZ13_10920 [Coraliomargarita sinensis]
MSRRYPYFHFYKIGIFSFRAATFAAWALLAPNAAQAQSAPGFVYENQSEFQALADINGDGEDDLVVADKSTGQLRIAESQGGGSLQWRENTAKSGLSPLSGFSFGPILDPSYDQIVASSELDNRIQIIDTRNDVRLSEPQRVPDTLIGPAVVSALNIPGGPAGYDNDFYDIAYHATLHVPSNPDTLSFFRNDGSGLPFPADGAGDSSGLPPRSTNRIELNVGKPLFYGMLADDGGSSVFRLLDPNDGLSTLVASLSGLPDDVVYVYADFDSDDRAEFVFYLPGTSTLIESEWTGSSLSSLTSFTYPVAIAELRVIDSAGQPELLVIHDGRDNADRTSYSGSGNFSVLEKFDADDAPIRGALSVEDKLHLLDGSGASASLRTFAFDGSGQHLLDETQALTPLTTPGTGSTVLLYDSAPLQDPDAQLLARYDAGPWTSAFVLNSGSAEVQSERFVGTTEGLGDAQSEIISALPNGTGGGMVNQIAADNSIFFKGSASGEITSELSVSPPSGSYARAVRPQFALEGSATICYRTSTSVSGWTEVNSLPPVIIDDATLYAVAVGGSGQFSNVVKVDYEITGDPGTRDSDGDGLPDFAAAESGIDPLASNDDADGDGFTDFQEVLAETDPNDDSSKPSRSNVSFEYPNSFDLYAAPGLPDPGAGTTLLRSFASADPEEATELSVYQPGGLLLGVTETGDNASLGYPAADFGALDAVADELFLVTSTVASFPVDDGGIPRDYGRQVAALVKLPELKFTPFDYTGYGDNGGIDNLSGETSDWRAAALAYFNSLTRPEVARDPVGPESTLELLLVEYILGRLLFAEGFSDRSELTLTPFRRDEDPLDPIAVGDPLPDPAPDSGRDRKLDASLLEERKKELSANGDPFYDVEGIIEAVRVELAAANTTGIQQLKTLAGRLYTTSATTSGASLRQPLPALRQFIRSGNLANTGYDDLPASSNFSPTLLAEAAQGIDDVASAITPQVSETIDLYVEGGEAAASCPAWKEVLYTANGFDPESANFTGTEYALLDAQGDAYPVARAFPLTVGSVIKVTGYVLDSAPCGDIALEVVSGPELAFLRNSSATDVDGNLIPDGIEERKPDVALNPFGDTDGDGYTDLQEILDGSDPDNDSDVPTDAGGPAPVAEVGPPQLQITSTGPTTAAIEFVYPADYVPFIEFELYSTSDLTTSFSPTGQKANHIGSGNHEQVVNQSGGKEFYIFRMKLK